MYNLQSIGRMFPHVMLPIPRNGFGSSFTLACVSQCSPLFLHSETGFGFGLDLAKLLSVPGLDTSLCGIWRRSCRGGSNLHGDRTGQIALFFPDFSYLFISSFDIIDIC